jgi:hypothetical protein
MNGAVMGPELDTKRPQKKTEGVLESRLAVLSERRRTKRIYRRYPTPVDVGAAVKNRRGINQSSFVLRTVP